MDKEKALSQKEIDALLSVLPADGQPLPGADKFPDSARPFDFRSADKFSKEQIRTLQMIHDNFARHVSSSLSAYLRTPVQVLCSHIEQGTFGDFAQNLPDASVTNVLRMAPLPNRVLLVLDAGTASAAVDRLLGGAGEPARVGHQITDIEQTLVREIIDYIIHALRQAWRNLIALEITTEEITLNPQFAQIALASDAAVFLTFETRVNQSSGMMSICIPYPVLKPIITELSPHTWVAGEAREGGAYYDELLEHLRQVGVDMSVLLGEATVYMRDLLQVKPGDVLLLDTSPRRSLPVLLQGKRKYQGRPRVLGNRLAVQISALMEDKA